ncbi:MAG: hypothetical protein Q9M18_08810 [Mariprofundaceae bacterium]|nr:hypothetical protein [Mariprofundaceae bacterium]
MSIQIEHIQTIAASCIIFLINSSRLDTWVDDRMIDGQIRLDTGIHSISLASYYENFSFELVVND